MTHNIKPKPVVRTKVPEKLRELDVTPTSFVATVEAAGGSRVAAHKLTKGEVGLHSLTMLVVSDVLGVSVNELFYLDYD